MKDNTDGLWRFDPKKHVIPADEIETKVVDEEKICWLVNGIHMDALAVSIKRKKVIVVNV